MQNRSNAVMATRVEVDDSLDDFPTPPWAGRALMEHVILPMAAGMCVHKDTGMPPEWSMGLEPACNRGHLVRGLAGYFDSIYQTDVHDYGWPGMKVTADFLFPGYALPRRPAWTITNPPFWLALQFIFKAMEVSTVGCAMLVRTSFLEGQDRYQELFSKLPPTIVAQFAERVIMHRGILRDPAVPYWDEEAGKMRRPSTATSYCWMVWMHGVPPQPFTWIPPCRTKLERRGDYPPVAADAHQP